MHLRHLAEIPLRRRLNHLVVKLAPADQGGLSLDRYRALGADVGVLPWLDINGQDPFARPDVADIVDAFTAQQVTVITPVLDVDTTVERTRAIRSDHRGELTLSLVLDGLHRTHDRIHGDGSWDRVWAAFDRLRAIPDLRLELRTAVRRDNLDELLALAEYVRGQGPEGHVVTLSATADDQAATPPVDRLEALQSDLFATLDRYVVDDGRLLTRMRRNFHRVRWDTALKTLREGRQVIPCLAGLSHAVVHGNGDVAVCELLPPLGSLAAQDWRAIWSGGALEAQRKYIGAGSCHCTDDCAMHDSIVLRPQNLPRLLSSARS